VTSRYKGRGLPSILFKRTTIPHILFDTPSPNKYLNTHDWMASAVNKYPVCHPQNIDIYSCCTEGGSPLDADAKYAKTLYAPAEVLRWGRGLKAGM
jgi:hypothetical protein